MPSVTVNFADVESFEPLPPGNYDVEIDKVEVRMNKAGDGLYLNWELIVLDGEYENRRLWMITSLKDTALFRLKQVFESLDVMDDDEEMEIEYDDDIEPSTSGGPRLVYPEVDGLEAVAVVKNEMYDNRERNRVEELLGEAPKPKRKSRKDSDNDQMARSKSRTKAKSRKRDEDEDDDDEDEEEEEQPRRSSRQSKRGSSSRGGSRRRVR